MRTRSAVVAALAATALSGPAPAARAGVPLHDCDYEAASGGGAGRQVFEGVMRGYVVHPGGGPAGIRCYVTVSGVEADSTDLPVFVGGVGLAFGQLTFTAGDTEVVEVCGEVTTPHGSFHHCYGPTNAGPFPPQEVFDLVYAALDATEDPPCAATRYVGGQGFNVLNQVVVAPDGDVYVTGENSLDCP